MRLFHNDYNEICHPAILERMQDMRGMQIDGYGMDACCERAARYIRSACDRDDLAVHFLVGGTQTNLIVIDAALRSHQAVIGAVSAHINVHETGAVEATGHKVLTLQSNDGKIAACQIRQMMRAHLEDTSREHTVQPKMVYISNPTELGTIYSLRELEDIASVCREYGLYLFVDGARLGYALAAEGNDVTLPDLARLADVFYIGGTKMGAMFGEAVVISNPSLALDFRYVMKQRGGMLAKGWLLGLQFEVLFEEGLYEQLGRHADVLAEQLRKTLCDLGYPMLVEGVTNQVFPILPDSVLAELEKEFSFCEQERIDSNRRAVRFCTSWATEPSDVNFLCEELIRLSK